jgi:very-short-patch-repair endonuclease
MNYSPPLVGGARGGGQVKDPLTSVARKLRSNSTEAEKCLWQALRSQGLGVKFRRQAVIGPYVVDFVCFEKKLVVEVDGGQHCQNQSDSIRDEWLSSQGFGTLRFWNNDVLENLDGVTQKIKERLEFPIPIPPHKGEGISVDVTL